MLEPMQLVRAEQSDLPFVAALEQRPEFRGFVGAWPPEQHQAAFADPDVRYYIMAGRAGFVILRGLAAQHRSIEVKRIIVAAPGQGTGRRALATVLALAFGHLYASLGFREDGVLREAWRHGDSYKSLVLMSILDREHTARG
jgi:RimJ/RimL family protein N-acetyltransferase